MSPTIRIDDEVYRWLQEQAVPFDDTPNSVLRRIAGFEMGETKMNVDSGLNAKSTDHRSKKWRRQPLARGDDLIRKWGIPARQARFHREGTFYEHLTDFPAALCDRGGYLLFESQSALEAMREIKLGKKLNVSGGISSIEGYVRVAEPIS